MSKRKEARGVRFSHVSTVKCEVSIRATNRVSSLGYVKPLFLSENVFNPSPFFEKHENSGLRPCCATFFEIDLFANCFALRTLAAHVTMVLFSSTIAEDPGCLRVWYFWILSALGANDIDWHSGQWGCFGLPCACVDLELWVTAYVGLAIRMVLPWTAGKSKGLVVSRHEDTQDGLER